MIEPLKATKGRRMSKKTQKKTQKKTLKNRFKAAAGKTPRSASRNSSAKPAVSKRPAKAAKPAAAASKRPAAKASHRGASKALKAQRPKAAAKPPASVKSTPRDAPRTPSAPKSETSLAANPLPLSTARAGLAEGTKAPTFQLPRDGGATVSLSDFAGRKLVLFFYPRADTPGCTREAIDFTRLAKAFAESKTAVLGVSADPPKAQEAFRSKHQLSVPLASDEQHAMLEAYGVWGEKSMYGRTFLGISRTTVLIGPDGRVIRIWRNVKVAGHADEVLTAAQST
jgi:thioredoxin-dependent peroxiredoxin